jgi:hypothetical protein
MFRDEQTGNIVFEYRVGIAEAGALVVRMPALMGQDGAAEVVEHLRSLANDVNVDAGIEDDGGEESARRELRRVCRLLRERPAHAGPTEGRDVGEPGTLEEALHRLSVLTQFLDAVESYLGCFPD